MTSSSPQAHQEKNLSQPAATQSENSSSEGSTPENSDPATSDLEAKKSEALEGADRNFLLLVLYQVVMRCGWIFKTETIIMPAVLDSISGAAWVRGILPILNRIGQSIPPLIYARRLKITKQKKWAFAITTFAMGICFLSLAIIFIPSIRTSLDNRFEALLGPIAKQAWLVVLFLLCYALFFAATGLNQLGFGTVQGKLVAAHHRGRLMLIANGIGAFLAIVLAATLLPLWLTESELKVHFIFGFAAATFFISGLFAMLLIETPDNYEEPSVGIYSLLKDSFRILKEDKNFRLLTFVAACFGCSLMLFPHYQAIARERLELPAVHLIYWVMIQNAGAACFSFIAGPLADAKGNRLVLQIFMLVLMLIPLGAMGLIYLGPLGGNLFSLLFLSMGIMPIMFRTLANYTLESADKPDHPRYLATLSLCIAAPVMFSPLVGWLIDLTSFELMFLLIAAILLTGWFRSFHLEEPRHQSTNNQASTNQN